MAEVLIVQSDIDDQTFLRPKDAARLLKLGETTIREGIYRGELPARKFRSRGWIIKREDLMKWYEESSESNVAA